MQDLLAKKSRYSNMLNAMNEAQSNFSKFGDNSLLVGLEVAAIAVTFQAPKYCII